jgi:hypothetical protein
MSNHKTHLCCVYTRGEEGYLWDQKLSVRSNQDNQREYEERAVRRMAALLTRRTCADSPSLYARMHSHSHGYHGLHTHSIWNSHIIPQGKFHLCALWHQSITECDCPSLLLQVESMFAWNMNGGKQTVIHMGTMEIQIVRSP